MDRVLHVLGELPGELKGYINTNYIHTGIVNIHVCDLYN